MQASFLYKKPVESTLYYMHWQEHVQHDDYWSIATVRVRCDFHQGELVSWQYFLYAITASLFERVLPTDSDLSYSRYMCYKLFIHHIYHLNWAMVFKWYDHMGKCNLYIRLVVITVTQVINFDCCKEKDKEKSIKACVLNAFSRLYY